MSEIGLIGVGLMGTTLARRLLAAGHGVVGYDVDPARREALRSLGGVAAASVGEVARRCPRSLIAVLTMAQVEEVVEGEDGLMAQGADGGDRIAICTATCEPDRIEALAQRAGQRGLALIDAPVSGTSQQVLKGEGFGLIAGDEAAVAAAEDILSVIYPRRTYTGPAGSATKTKLAINHILGLNRVALAEGLVFAERLGLEPRRFLEVARQSAAYSQIMDVKGGKMVEGDFAPVSKVTQHLKDVRIMLAEAQRRGQQLPLLSVLRELLEACERHGEGERDNAITIEEIRRRRCPPPQGGDA